MLVALLASVSAGIFAAHILDAFRTGQHAVDAWPSHSASDRAALRSRRSPPTPLQTPAPLQSRYDSNSGVRLLHVNDRFAARSGRSRVPFGATDWSFGIK